MSAGVKSYISRYTILFIGPNLNESNPVYQLLENEGYDVIHCSSPESTKEILNECKPDLLVFDLAYSGLGNLQSWYEIRESIQQWEETLLSFFILSDEQKQQILNSSRESLKESDTETFLQENAFHVLQPHPENPSPENLKELRYRLEFTLHMHNRFLEWQDNYKLLQRSHRSMRREMMEVWNIQRLFLTREFPKHPDFHVVTSYQPSAEVGGDYYDLVKVDEEHWGLVMADIAGHGASAAVVMALTQMTVKEFAPGVLRPGEALNVFDNKLNEHLNSQHFVTMFYAILNLRTLELVFTSAGHSPPLWFSNKTGMSSFLKSIPAFPLRTFQNHSYDEQSVFLSPGDRLLLFTDGVTDLQNNNDELYDVERLRNVFHQKQHLPIDDLIQAINHDTEEFRNGRERMDDFTLMLVELNSQSSSKE